MPPRVAAPQSGGREGEQNRTQYDEYYSPLPPEFVQESLREYPAPPCVLFFYARDVGELVFFPQNAALAEALASFSSFRSFRIALPLQRWPIDM